MQGLTCKKRVLGWGFNFTKAQGLKQSKNDLVGIIVELGWMAGCLSENLGASLQNSQRLTGMDSVDSGLD